MLLLFCPAQALQRFEPRQARATAIRRFQFIPTKLERSMEGSRICVLQEFLREAEYLELDPAVSSVNLMPSSGRVDEAAANNNNNNNNPEDMQVMIDGAVVRVFNAALQRHRGVRFLFCSGVFEGLGEPGRKGLERLFSTVLPSHPTLEDISIGEVVPVRLPKLLFRALVETRSGTATAAAAAAAVPTLPCLQLGGPIANYAEDLGTMLSRNAPVASLWINYLGVLASECQRVCDGLPTNTHLRTLSISSTGLDVRPSTFRNAFGATSPLTTFCCGTPPQQWSLDSFLAAMEALRTNATLEDLNLVGFAMPDLTDLVPHVDHLLHRHNYTLRQIRCFDRDPLIQKRLRENDRVREAVAGLRRSQFRLEPRAGWPDALGRISSKPALVYKFLREGNCSDVARHLSVGDGRGQP
jgi:hypothetical protein